MQCTLAMNDWESQEGAPYPLGVTWVEHEEAFNFALYAKHATGVRLLTYRQDELSTPAFVLTLEHRSHKTGPIWHCRVAARQLGDACYYAYQVDGPREADFDPEKVLLDPYARGVFFPADFSRQRATGPGANEGQAPLAVLCPTQPHTTVRPLQRRPRHGSDLVIYEMHIKGFTASPSSGLSHEQRGTYSGVIAKVPYLKQLGVTAVQLMPIFQFDPQEGNYWGYMPLNFFSPHQQYSKAPQRCQQADEFRKMVTALHDAGIEVILDVVYNHTAEGDHRGPTYSFRGIDARSYYMTSSHSAGMRYVNFSGTGNTLDTTNRAVRQLIVDSLRYWAAEMQVDGFRFDLASIFSRCPDGSLNTSDPPIFGQIAADPILAKMRLIAEPWDAAGAYQLGRSFPGYRWLQWNGRYRDALQRFVRGDGGLVGEVMTRLYGSDDLFPDDLTHAFRPYQSLNYLTSHDGFTLYDLVSYREKNNWANGENNRDGPDDYSTNCGWEGEDNAPSEVGALRRQQVKNFFCLLMLSNGTPMFRMGDEFCQTQGGNNNPYNQDNATTWLDWRRVERHADVLRFFQRMIAFRHAHPCIARSRFWRDDIRWYGIEGRPDLSFESSTLAYCLHGSTMGDGDLYVMINMGTRAHNFRIHERAGQWQRAVDTAWPSPDDIVDPLSITPWTEPVYPVQARSVVVLERR